MDRVYVTLSFHGDGLIRYYLLWATTDLIRQYAYRILSSPKRVARNRPR